MSYIDRWTHDQREWMNEEEFGIHWWWYEPLKRVIFSLFYCSFVLSWRDTHLEPRAFYMLSVVCGCCEFSLVLDCVSWPPRELQLVLGVNSHYYIPFVNRFSFLPTCIVCCVKLLRFSLPHDHAKTSPSVNTTISYGLYQCSKDSATRVENHFFGSLLTTWHFHNKNTPKALCSNFAQADLWCGVLVMTYNYFGKKQRYFGKCKGI